MAQASKVMQALELVTRGFRFPGQRESCILVSQIINLPPSGWFSWKIVCSEILMQQLHLAGSINKADLLMKRHHMMRVSNSFCTEGQSYCLLRARNDIIKEEVTSLSGWWPEIRTLSSHRSYVSIFFYFQNMREYRDRLIAGGAFDPLALCLAPLS